MCFTLFQNKVTNKVLTYKSHTHTHTYIYIYIYIYTSILLYGCTTWTLTKRLEKKLDGNYTRMLRANLEQVLAATPHKTPTVRPPASYHENYSS